MANKPQALGGAEEGSKGIFVLSLQIPPVLQAMTLSTAEREGVCPRTWLHQIQDPSLGNSFVQALHKHLQHERLHHHGSPFWNHLTTISQDTFFSCLST
ncbi:hypothetical protein VULLAG_LOCUS19746 [Vulpes lagopus]